MTAFTAWRCASGVYAVVVCLSVCLSVHHKPVLYRNDWTNRAGICHGGVPFTHPTLLYWIWVIPKIRVLFSGTLYQTSDLENLGAASQLHCPQAVVVGGGACWRHLYNSWRVVAVYYKSISCNPPTPLLWFVVDLSYNLFLQLTRFWLT